MTNDVASKWEILARERNARVVLCHTPDTYTLIDIARMADRGIRALRNRLLITLPIDDVVPLLERYNETLLALHNVVEAICEKAEIPYKTPRSIKKMLKSKGDGDASDPTLSDWNPEISGKTTLSTPLD
ncbi:MAG: hypothetical protein DRG59_03700 [Deltaproteobacteria bacterium]|nr:MAG: hypothetical protein DRG83_21125 [Deltaproteobacteria bacterium]RLB08956.1 MAG: hypothetical protein DRG59_03700 [Deltaproteobacteria bacterium]